MDKMNSVILAGGKCSRMNSDKARLQINGKTFLTRIASQLQDLGPVFLSVAHPDDYQDYPMEKIVDQVQDCGPICGIVSSLERSDTPWTLIVTCDIPLFKKELAEFLLANAEDAYDAVVIKTREGGIHPLCALYAQSAKEVFRGQLHAGNYKVYDAFKKMNVKYLSLKYSIFSDDLLQNINTQEDYRRLKKENELPPVVAVSGAKNSGKTTLLEGILPILKEKGIRVAAIKHDGHDFIPDVPQTDSYRIRMAGAYGVTIFSKNRYMTTVEKAGTDLENLIETYREADIVIVEGGKKTNLPKIEVVRRNNSPKTICDEKSVIGLCTDTEIKHSGITFGLNDYDRIANYIMEFVEREVGRPNRSLK